MMTINSVAKAIAERLENADSYIVDFDMKKGGSISVENLGNNRRYTVWFAEYGVITYAKDCNELAEIMINYPAKAEEIVAEENAWRERNIPKVQKMFKENFEGKTWEQIRNNEALYELWGEYSDYHKDCYGYRPHGIVCGVYINPHA